MFNFFKKKSVEPKDENKKILSLACLLVEAALVDEDFGKEEKDTIFNILKKQFKFEDDLRIDATINEAIENFKKSSDLITYTRDIKDNWKLEDRVNIIEMLWTVCLVDKKLKPYEDMLIRRVAGLIYVDDKNRGLAKKKALANLNN